MDYIKELARGSIYIPTKLRELAGITDSCIVNYDEDREVITLRKL